MKEWKRCMVCKSTKIRDIHTYIYLSTITMIIRYNYFSLHFMKIMRSYIELHYLFLYLIFSNIINIINLLVSIKWDLYDSRYRGGMNGKLAKTGPTAKRCANKRAKSVKSIRREPARWFNLSAEARRVSIRVILGGFSPPGVQQARPTHGRVCDRLAAEANSRRLCKFEHVLAYAREGGGWVVPNTIRFCVHDPGT